MTARLVQSILTALAGLAVVLAPAARAATFNGTSRANAGDSTSAFSGGTNNGLTVSCWFKMSIPSNVTLSKDMVIVSNRQTSTAGGNFAFEIAFGINSGLVEFRARGASALLTAQTLIAQPFLERWYHVAVTRSGDTFTGYLDGRQIFSTVQGIGAVTNSNGVTIGGTSDSANLYGEVIEGAIYNTALTQTVIRSRMFVDQPVGNANLRGYYKLAATPAANQLKNLVTIPPASTDPLTASGTVTFEDANEAGEQSTFDSHRNGGRDATAPLSGAFSWERTVFRRPTVGVPFEFKVGYNSGNSGGGFNIPDYSQSDTNGLGAGWTHTFDVRIVPSEVFQQSSSTATVGLMLWDGSLEVWDYVAAGAYRTRHGEYRGELSIVPNDTGDPNSLIVWTTPDRLQYRFFNPFNSAIGEEALIGRLKDIRDFSGNAITLTWLTDGRLKKVTDTAGADCVFNYGANDSGTLLTTVTYLGWTATFTPTAAAANRIATLKIDCPPAYASTPAIPTTSGFFYRTSVPATDATFGLLEKIADPRGYNGGMPNYYDTQITYDNYGRVAQERDGLNRLTERKYGVDETGVAAPRKVTRIDGTGMKWVDAFDRKLRVTGRRDPLGNTTVFEINDATGTVAATVDANTNRTEFTYDARANVLTKKVVALNETTTWEYNAVAGTVPNTVPLNKPTKQTDPPAIHSGQAAASWVTNFDYDSGGNLLRQYDALGDLVTNTYTTRGQLLTVKDARNNVSSLSYTPEGFLATKTVPDVGGTSRTWTYGYTELGWLKTETNPLPLTTYFFQNINGQVITTIDPLGRDFQKTYDANGNLLTDADGLHIATTYTYDNANQRTAMLTRDGKTWNYGYSDRGEQLFVRDPSLTAPTNTVTYLYDDAGRRTKETDALGFFTQFFPDANGNVTKTTDKENRDWTKKYDALNRVTEDTDPEGDKTVTTYDPAGRIATVTNPRGLISLHEYDGRNRLAKWTDTQGYVWLYTYDGNGNITDIEDALHGHYVMTYGPRNERLSEENQDHFVWSYTYDELLRLKTQTDPTAGAAPALVRTLHYDNGGRVESVDFSTGRQTVFFFNDNNDPLSIRRTFPAQATVTLDLTYDAMDRVTQSRDTFAKTIGYTFDAVGRVKTKVYPGGKTLTQNYDLAGRLTTLVDWAATPRTSTFTYDKVGRLKTHVFPNGISAAVGYDNAGRVTSLDHGPVANPQQIALRYAYDRNGNKTSETKKGALDWQPGAAAGQVPPFDESYTPTAAGRLISSTDTLNPARNASYAYNPAGDMTGTASPAANYTFTYDEDHRVTTVGFNDGATTKAIANRYDAVGRRLARTLTLGAAAPVETRYVLDLTGDMERILADTDSTGTVLARYIHGPDGLGYREDATPNTITCYHADAMGNILRLTDATGTAIADYTYSPYGRLLASTGTASNAYRFVGSQGVTEELPNLYFMRARYYSAETGIFLSTDAVKNIGPGWKSVAYAYANANPISFFDPQGTLTLTVGGSVGGGGAFGLGAEQTFGIGLAFDSDAFVEGDFGNAFGLYLSESSTVKGGAIAEAGPVVTADFGWSNTGYGVKAIQSSSMSKPDVSAGVFVSGGASVSYTSSLHSGQLSVGGKGEVGVGASASGGYTKVLSLADLGSYSATSLSPKPITKAPAAVTYATTLNSLQPRTGPQLQPAPQAAPPVSATNSGGGGLDSKTASSLSSTLTSISKNLGSFNQSQLNQLGSILKQLSATLTKLAAAQKKK